ncbi:MAG: aminotransferase class V-fold PLP-dependent enzyme [Acidobacteria bacterium]|nr:aminotransferase class V-fold PLP-dependent enzyme [Acidobacteriota bacterium]
MQPETLALHAAELSVYGSVASPIVLSTTYERDADNQLVSEYFYSRTGHPNRQAFEQIVSALEGGTVAAAFASGNAATQAVMHALAPGDHVIAPVDIYFGTRAVIESLYTRWGLQVSFVDTTDLDAIKAAWQPTTKLVWIETPSNPRLRITDIAAAAELAHARGALLAADNTWATPICTRPFEHGADIVMHSTTKYFGGHSDTLSGLIVMRDSNEFFERIRTMQTIGGTGAAPFDCWLLQRSVATMAVRVERQSQSAAQLAEALSQHTRIANVNYPGLASHAGHAIAARQMRPFGGMLSIEVAGGAEEALRMIGKVQLFKRATSLGGVESLIEHRASVEGPQSKTPPNLLRVSVGLEHADDLLADLLQALD